MYLYIEYDFLMNIYGIELNFKLYIQLSKYIYICSELKFLFNNSILRKFNIIFSKACL